jgi:azurin
MASSFHSIMSDTHSKHSQDSTGGFWSFANIIIGALIAGVALSWGVALVRGGIVASQRLRAPQAEPAPAVAAAAPAATAPAAGGAAAAPVVSGPVQELALGPDAVNPMLFSVKLLKARAGQPIKLTFDNSGSAAPQPHNVVVGKAGSKDALTAASVKIMTDPAGMGKGFVPEDPAVLAAIKMLQPGGKDSVTFTLPAAGDYPFMCMFPGHGILMNGVIHAE